MKNDETNDTFLADWLAGKLTDQELRIQIGDEDFAVYQKLRASLDALELKAPDLDSNYAAVKSKKVAALDAAYQPKVRPFMQYVAIAATILVLVGLYNLFVFSNRVQTDFGQHSEISLADDSKVMLNAKSTLSYPNFFALNRTLKLDGEAFFEVSKGSAFTVKTPQGRVEVLGTKFNVVAREGFFEVSCTEGRVMVCQDGTEAILTPGEAIRYYGSRIENLEIPTANPMWMQGESRFRNAPLKIVLGELENQYGRSIICPQALQSVRFTGSFTHKNLATALESVCIPLQLQYSQANGKIEISE